MHQVILSAQEYLSHYLYFSDEKTETERGDLYKFTRHLGGRSATNPGNLSFKPC